MYEDFEFRSQSILYDSTDKGAICNEGIGDFRKRLGNNMKEKSYN